ncbi:hypothetical protein L210DRAFT_953523 [Boletus edulis BED1]|uniref:Uncharacterized protein n=1 Tax=Boletus edulis BED1 TaxID=1328754 RepID=A0AAD4BQK8_BOLED|nr:hypothetical protein L210DRAFT_953523 [Boletus edulis BED1]
MYSATTLCVCPPFPQQLPTLESLVVNERILILATEFAEVTTAWFNALSGASSNIPAILHQFLDDGFGNDTLASTWDFRAIEPRDAIRSLLDHCIAPTGFVNLRLCKSRCSLLNF